MCSYCDVQYETLRGYDEANRRALLSYWIFSSAFKVATKKAVISM